jgi:hypothetical protein
MYSAVRVATNLKLVGFDVAQLAGNLAKALDLTGVGPTYWMTANSG